MTKIAFISDVHMGPSYVRKGVRRKLTEYSESNISSFLEYISSEGDFSFAVQLGDLIEDLKVDEDTFTYRKGIEILEKCSVPIHHVVGNHDSVHISSNDLQDILSLESLYYSFDHGGYHFVVLCIQVPDPKTPRIILPDEQFSWLAKDLDETNKPTVIFATILLRIKI
ncbi:MAG: metallophosphoesterase [Chloroflexi bacterium]|nr:metallophosphoesterase [Chloroflexota bacterium]MBL7163228.1 metallophosphoesterase [Anaerolineales bacterium]